MQPVEAAQGRQPAVDRCRLRLGAELRGEKRLDIGTFGGEQLLARIPREPIRPCGEIAAIAGQARRGESVLQPDLVAERVDQLDSGAHRRGSPPESITFVLQKPALYRDRIAVGHTHEAAQRALAADNTMAGNDQRDRIGAAGATDCTRRRRKLARHFAVGARLADRNPRQRVPDPAAERRAFRCQRQVKRNSRIGQITLELAARALCDRIGWAPARARSRQVFDAGDRAAGTCEYRAPRRAASVSRNRLDPSPRRSAG